MKRICGGCAKDQMESREALTPRNIEIIALWIKEQKSYGGGIFCRAFSSAIIRYFVTCSVDFHESLGISLSTSPHH